MEKNILKTQLQTGMIEKPSIAACAKDSGAVSFTLSQGEGECSDDKSTAESSQLQLKVPKYSNTQSKTKRNRGTQTEAFMIPFAVTSVGGPSEGNQHTFLWG